jgi:TRAP transporter TAXI family solute receptor
LKNIDVAIVQSDVLKHFQASKEIPDIRDKVHYITKLYNEEVHILARSGVTTLKDLAGQRVNFGPKGSGTAMTSAIVFAAEDLQVNPTYLSNSEGLAALKAGTVDAAIFVAGKPTSLFREIQAGSGLHFLNVDYSKALEETYLDATLTNKDYPNLIKDGEKVETVAVGAVMAAYNWKKGSSRYERTETFVRRMFEGLPVLRSDAYHPKWKEVDINGKVPGWQRFSAADEWIQSKGKR